MLDHSRAMRVGTNVEDVRCEEVYYVDELLLREEGTQFLNEVITKRVAHKGMQVWQERWVEERYRRLSVIVKLLLKETTPCLVLCQREDVVRQVFVGFVYVGLRVDAFDFLVRG